MGSKAVQVLAGGAEVAPCCRFDGRRVSGSRPGGPSGPLGMAGVSCSVTVRSAGIGSPTLRYHEGECVQAKLLCA
eukprot:42078-Alexandrium_andersonii.AAC.1